MAPLSKNKLSETPPPPPPPPTPSEIELCWSQDVG